MFCLLVFVLFWCGFCFLLSALSLSYTQDAARFPGILQIQQYTAAKETGFLDLLLIERDHFQGAVSEETPRPYLPVSHSMFTQLNKMD